MTYKFQNFSSNDLLTLIKKVDKFVNFDVVILKVKFLDDKLWLTMNMSMINLFTHNLEIEEIKNLVKDFKPVNIQNMNTDVKYFGLDMDTNAPEFTDWINMFDQHYKRLIGKIKIAEQDSEFMDMGFFEKFKNYNERF